MAAPHGPLVGGHRPALSPELHRAVFGALPSRLAAALRKPAAAALVEPLLDRGWRPGQLASRIGALPAAPDPEAAVFGLLVALIEEPTPAQRAAQERSARAASAPARATPAPAPVRERYLAQIRHELGLRRRPARAPLPPPASPTCAACRKQASFFVTRSVRLCASCVAVLATGRAQLVEQP